MAFDLEAKEIYNISLKAEEGINLFQPPPVMIFNNEVVSSVNIVRGVSIDAIFNSSVSSSSQVEVGFGTSVSFNSSGTSETNIVSGVGSFAEATFSSNVISEGHFDIGIGQIQTFTSESTAVGRFNLILDPELVFGSSVVSATNMALANLAPQVTSPELSVPEVTPYSFTVSYTPPEDETDDANLDYYLYISDSDNLNTDVATVEANGNLHTQDTGVTELTANALDQNTQYFFNIVVEDEQGEKAIYNSASITTERETNFYLETFEIV